MRVKIHNFQEVDPPQTVWVSKSTQVGFNEYRVEFSLEPENALEFDDDEYVLKLFAGWFGKENVELCG